MKVKYRVIHQSKSIWQALARGRSWTEWYLAQRKGFWGWKTLGTYQTVEEAEQACAEHAKGELLNCGSRIVSEFAERE
ncbi:hypothetical protein [Parasphingopyxis lamellibrachiae]|uniref:Uncharacterized protein n=1 Tax=Parasphingopyxis lamellibrachiae TaxID=680125 RepID=A0A3D9FF87_9SPHN|nr:hypothetical protein [Parasphingopyxis lamellibrachiae]RED16449.1 hypothetical protein DFR46_1472 [Parasphingopyxis lamellibrachiae]